MRPELLDRAADWLGEPRLPHHFPLWLWRRSRFGNLSLFQRETSGRVALALTFDVEHDPLPIDGTMYWTTCEPFLRWLGEMGAAHNWRTTLFVQGSLVEPLARVLTPLAAEHEIGLHGYEHELWGRPLWFAHHRSTPRTERLSRLMRGIQGFVDIGLPRPRSFRAPYLVCDRLTLDLLEQTGFELDSSEAAFRGCLPVVSRRRQLARVPVSATPRPRIRRRFGLPTWAPYDLLNVATFLHAPTERLLALIEEILAVQALLGSPPHLVVLAHPWEFADCALPGCSVSNQDRLLERMSLIASRLPIRVTTLSDVAKSDANTAIRETDAYARG